MSRARNFLISHLSFLILLVFIGTYLALKALPKNSWDGWRVGSAQALLSDKHWAQDGFIKSYFLFLPQGYSKAVRYFDDPELRHHARGITTGGFIGKRLYYTHYPSGYLIPTAVLMKLGLQSRFWFRFLEILFSLSGLLLLYLIFNFISSDKITAFLGVTFYGVSTLFLDYADSLANQPLDELLRLGVIFLSILALKNPRKNYLKYFIWLAYFALSVSSYDSTFFVLAWLVGLDLIQRKFDWKKWAFWATAPVAAFAVQIIQNVWYLGWRDMTLDLYGTFKVQILGSKRDFFLTHVRRLIEPFGWFFGTRWFLGILIAPSGLVSAWFLKDGPENKGNYKYLILGFRATLIHFLFFPSLFFYQARILSLFGGLLVAILTIKSIRALFRKSLWLKLKILSLAVLILMLSLWLIQAKRTYAYIKAWPNNVWPQEKIDFDKKIKNLTRGDKVIFQILGLEKTIPGPDRWPAAATEDEYYTDAPILGFTRINDLTQDLSYIRRRSSFEFATIIITDRKEIMQKIQISLKDVFPDQKVINSEIMGRFILLIFDSKS